MAYEYEKENIRKLNSYNVLSGGANITKPIDELQEVYRKAKAFDEIVIETTGAIMNCPPRAVGTEAGRITLGIIENYDLEDE